MALVSRARARFKFFGTLALALAQFLARSRAPEKSSALAFNSDDDTRSYRLIEMKISFGCFCLRALRVVKIPLMVFISSLN